MANIDLEVYLGLAGSVELGGPTHAARGFFDLHVEVSAACEFVEMMASDVSVQLELGGTGAGGDTVVGVREQENLASSWVAERRGDCGYGRGKLGRAEFVALGERGGLFHAATLLTMIGEILSILRRRLSGAPMTVTEAEVIDALRPVQDPELHRSIVDLGMVRSTVIDGGHVEVGIDLTIAGCPLRNQIRTEVTDAVSVLSNVSVVTLDFGVMNDEQRAKVRELVHGNPSASAGSQAAHGHAEGRAIPFAAPGNRTRTLLIASGKGGVGKSSVTANLGIALAQQGHSVAVIDADVWGFSIPRMLGVAHAPTVIDDMIVPPETHGVRCISMGFFAKEDQPVIWRGPMLHKALEQFLTDVYWDEPDFLLVDLPPGTGDIALSLAQFLPRAEALVVTTPNPAAQRVAQRSAFMFDQVNISVKGVIENMSWFIGDDGKHYPLFGSGGGKDLADRLGVDLVGQVPMNIALREGSDQGNPIMAADPTNEASLVFVEMAKWVVAHAPSKRTHPELKII